jgi:hypothetical protein
VRVTAELARTTILDEDGRVLDTCSGPDQSGRCPKTADDGTLPCAGHILHTQSTGRAGWELRVHPMAIDCPLQAPRVWAKQPGHRWGPAHTTA